MDNLANISMDTFSLWIFVIVLFAAFKGKNSQSKSILYFRWITVNGIIINIGDLCDWIFRGREGRVFYYILWCAILMFYLGTGLLVASLIFYLKDIVENHGRKTKILPIIGIVSVSYMTIICVMTLFAHNVFYIDQTNTYQRGPLFMLTQIPIIIYVIVVFTLILYRNLLTGGERFFLSFFTFTPTIGEIVQMIYPDRATVLAGMSCAVLYLLVFVQKEKGYQEAEQKNENLDNQNKILEEKLEREDKMLVSIMNVLTNTSEIKVECNKGHGMRVGNYTREIAYRMGLSEDFQIEAYFAGMLHDIGMTKVPDTLVSKPTTLTDSEYEIVKLHPISGFHLVKQLSEYPLIMDAVRWHHERYDGTGYPNGLAGEDIPLIARIVSVANAYDAMTSNRTYRKKLSREDIIEEFSKCAGHQFDANITQIIIEMIKEDISFEMQEKESLVEQSILIVDDDPVMHQFAESVFADEKYCIACAKSGREAIELMENEEFSLCILDIEMPQMNGFEVLDWIVASKKDVKVLFMTENRKIDTIRRVEALDVKEYITKPVSAYVLKECVRNVLNDN